MADETILRDGVQIPLPGPTEKKAFDAWLAANKVREPMHPDQHYDYVGAFREGMARAPGEQGHFKDTYKLPGHETFSNESKYAIGPNAVKAGYWREDTFVPPTELGQLILDLLKQQSTASRLK